MPDYGVDTSITLRTVALPFPDGSTRLVTALQPDKTFRTSKGRERLAESLVCRLLTDRGTLPDVLIPSTVRTYGTNVEDFVNAEMTVRDRAKCEAFISAECRKDSRVIAAATTATAAGPTLVVACSITDGAGPFPLVLAVSDVSANVLSAPR